MQQRAIFRTSTNTAAPMRLVRRPSSSPGLLSSVSHDASSTVWCYAEFGRIRGAAIRGKTIFDAFCTAAAFLRVLLAALPAKSSPPLAHLSSAATRRRGGQHTSPEPPPLAATAQQLLASFHCEVLRGARRLLDSGTAPGHNSTLGGAQDSWVRRRPRAVCNRGEHAACVCGWYPCFPHETEHSSIR